MLQIKIRDGINSDKVQTFKYGVEAQEFIFEEDYARYIVLNVIKGCSRIRPERLPEFVLFHKDDERLYYHAYYLQKYEIEIAFGESDYTFRVIRH